MEKHSTYDATFKGKVILSTKKIGIHAAGRKYTVRHVYINGKI
jgi:hypothetical protein